MRLSDYGYNRMTIHNLTHLSLEQVSDRQVLMICRYDCDFYFDNIFRRMGSFWII
jgi:hypothetical protein